MALESITLLINQTITEEDLKPIELRYQKELSNDITPILPDETINLLDESSANNTQNDEETEKKPQNNSKANQNKLNPLTDTQATVYFHYATALIQSKYSKDWQQGREILQNMYQRSKDEHAKRDYLFYCAISEIKLKNLQAAAKFVNAILYIEPFNEQAASLNLYISREKKKNLLIGAGVAIGTVSFAGAIAIGLIGAMVMRK